MLLTGSGAGLCQISSGQPPPRRSLLFPRIINHEMGSKKVVTEEACWHQPSFVSMKEASHSWICHQLPSLWPLYYLNKGDGDFPPPPKQPPLCVLRNSLVIEMVFLSIFTTCTYSNRMFRTPCKKQDSLQSISQDVSLAGYQRSRYRQSCTVTHCDSFRKKELCWFRSESSNS